MTIWLKQDVMASAQLQRPDTSLVCYHVHEECRQKCTVALLPLLGSIACSNSMACLPIMMTEGLQYGMWLNLPEYMTSSHEAA